MTPPRLIFCSAESKRYTKIAAECGLELGAQLPGVVHPFGPLVFADQNWKRPDRAGYMAALSVHRPDMATVLVWEREEQLAEVLSWAEEAAALVGRFVVLIPKVIGGAARLPRRIGGRDVLLGYSAASTYGGTPVPIWEFAGWPVHILGGSPQRQMTLWRYLVGMAEVVSVDGNVLRKMANRCMFFAPAGRYRQASNRYFPQLREIGEAWGADACYECFRRSCLSVRAAWDALCA
jgi:hypothetical protein